MKTISFYQSINHSLRSFLFVIGLVLFLNFPQQAKAQTLTIYADSIVADTGEVVNVSIRIKDFKDIASIQFGVSWDAMVLEFLEVKDFNSLRDLNIGNFLLPKTGENILLFAWFDNRAKGLSLTDDIAIFKLSFKVIGNEGNRSEIDIGDKLFIDAEAATTTDIINLNLQKGLVHVKSPLPPVPVPEIVAPMIPTLSQWGLFILGLLILNVGLLLIRRSINIAPKR